jgi:antitoxin component of RelBE/YafQ-DinJ toxin-antitoxin module
MSLQGPTIILSMKGQEKIKEEQRQIIEKMGMVILG